jgi:hypothetical protein
MSVTIHSMAVAQVENALRSNGIAIAGFTGVVVNTTDGEMTIGGDVFPAGKFVAVEFKAVVPISE